MGYFVSFQVEGHDDPADGDHVASTAGWAAFLDWAGALDEEEWPELAWLSENAWSDDPVRLEDDLADAVKAKPGKPSPDVLGVARSLLDAVRARPEGAVALVVTDGTEGEEG